MHSSLRTAYSVSFSLIFQRVHETMASNISEKPRGNNIVTFRKMSREVHMNLMLSSNEILPRKAMLKKMPKPMNRQAKNWKVILLAIHSHSCLLTFSSVQQAL